MAQVAQQLGPVDVTKLRRMYKRLGADEKGVAQHWVMFAMFTNCVQQSFDVACPRP